MVFQFIQAVFKIPYFSLGAKDTEIYLLNDPRISNIPNASESQQSLLNETKRDISFILDMCDQPYITVATIRWKYNPYNFLLQQTDNNENGNSSIYVTDTDMNELDFIKCGRLLRLRKIQDNITFSFSVPATLIEYAQNTSRVPVCAYFDTQTVDYSTEGCTSIYVESTNTLQCSCDHLTAFTIGLKTTSNDKDNEYILFLKLSLQPSDYLFWVVIMTPLLLLLPYVSTYSEDRKDVWPYEKRCNDIFLDIYPTNNDLKNDYFLLCAPSHVTCLCICYPI